MAGGAASGASAVEALCSFAAGAAGLDADALAPLRAAARAASLLVRAAGAMEAGTAAEEELAGDEERASDAGRGRLAASTGAVSAGRFALDLAANAESLDVGFEGAAEADELDATAADVA